MSEILPDGWFKLPDRFLVERIPPNHRTSQPSFTIWEERRDRLGRPYLERGGGAEFHSAGSTNEKMHLWRALCEIARLSAGDDDEEAKP